MEDVWKFREATFGFLEEKRFGGEGKKEEVGGGEEEGTIVNIVIIIVKNNTNKCHDLPLFSLTHSFSLLILSILIFFFIVTLSRNKIVDHVF